MAIAMMTTVQIPLLSFYCMPGGNSQGYKAEFSIHSLFITYFLSTYYLPGTTLITKGIEFNEIDAGGKNQACQ